MSVKKNLIYLEECGQNLTFICDIWQCFIKPEKSRRLDLKSLPSRLNFKRINIMAFMRRAKKLETVIIVEFSFKNGIQKCKTQTNPSQGKRRSGRGRSLLDKLSKGKSTKILPKWLKHLVCIFAPHRCWSNLTIMCKGGPLLGSWDMVEIKEPFSVLLSWNSFERCILSKSFYWEIYDDSKV